MDATTWKRAGWLTDGAARAVEFDGVAVQVVAHTAGLDVQHATGMAYRITTTTTTTPTRAGCRTAWLCPVCGARCNRLGMAGLMLGCGACCKLARRATVPRPSRAADTRHSASLRAKAGLELARVVWGWVTCSNKQTKKRTNKRTNVHCPATCTEAPVVGAWFYSDETQRAHYTARRAEIREALTPCAPTEWRKEGEVGESGNEISTLSQPKPKTGRGNTQFAAETSALTGESKQSINRNLARAEAIGDAPTRSKGTPAVC